MPRYAEGTKVSVESSRGEITGILAKHGVDRMGWSTGPHGDELLFELDGNRYRFQIIRPTLDEVKAAYVAEGGRWNLVYDPDAKVQAEWRRRWRANVLLIKAKLEFAQGGDTTVARPPWEYNFPKTETMVRWEGPDDAPVNVKYAVWELAPDPTTNWPGGFDL